MPNAYDHSGRIVVGAAQNTGDSRCCVAFQILTVVSLVVVDINATASTIDPAILFPAGCVDGGQFPDADADGAAPAVGW